MSEDEATMDVAGNWSFDVDPGDVGLDQRWFRDHIYPGMIRLPGTTDLAGIGEQPPDEERLLTRVHRYLGPAWYSRRIVVPQDWEEKTVSLVLERVIFESRVWVDGNPVGIQDSLVAPHVHSLGVLEPGPHTLTVRIDNRMVQPIGTDGHGYTEFTQTIWNGAIGRIALHAKPPTHLGLLRVFPDGNRRAVQVEVALHNITDRPGSGRLDLVVHDPDGAPVVSTVQEVTPGPGSSRVTSSLRLPNEPRRWDEFAPNLYSVRVIFTGPGGRDTAEVRFGFRDLDRHGSHLTMNGRKTFLRGGMDHSIFPLTGHPPMDVAGWREVFRVYRDHGFNQLRFHSWTPPEAAFEAADELGFYLQVEVTWIQYAFGSGQPLRASSSPSAGAVCRPRSSTATTARTTSSGPRCAGSWTPTAITRPSSSLLSATSWGEACGPSPAVGSRRRSGTIPGTCTPPRPRVRSRRGTTSRTLICCRASAGFATGSSRTTTGTTRSSTRPRRCQPSPTSSGSGRRTRHGRRSRSTPACCGPRISSGATGGRSSKASPIAIWSSAPPPAHSRSGSTRTRWRATCEHRRARASRPCPCRTIPARGRHWSVGWTRSSTPKES